MDYQLPLLITLDKALDNLLTQQGIPWTVDQAAFVAAQQNKDVVRTTGVSITDKMVGVSRETVLKLLLAKIPSAGGPGQATYLIRPGSVEITTVRAAMKR